MSVARAFVPLVAAVALLLAFRGGQTLVTLLLLAYSIVTQLFPALVGALVWPRFVTASGAIAGLLVGEVIVAVTGIGSITLGQLLPSWPAVVTDVNPGVIALLSNTASLVVVSALQRKFARPRHLSASGD